MTTVVKEIFFDDVTADRWTYVVGGINPSTVKMSTSLNRRKKENSDWLDDPPSQSKDGDGTVL